MIHILAASKAYAHPTDGTIIVLRPTTLSIPVNRRVGILGEPGAGKSTVLELITGSEAPSSGEIVSASKLSPIIGMPGLLSLRLTGFENAAYFARMYGLPVEAMLECVAILSDLKEELGMPLRNLGMAQRSWLLFCIIIALGVDCIVADGVLVGRHPGYAEKARRMIMERTGGPGLIFASGNPKAVRALCDLVVVIRDGTLWPFDDVDEGIRFFNR